MIDLNISLEDSLRLDTVRLFLNSFDVTFAFDSIFHPSDIKQILHAACFQQPYKGFRKISTSTSFRKEYRTLTFKDKKVHNPEAHRLHLQNDEVADRFMLQAYFDYMISKPLIMINLPYTSRPGTIQSSKEVIDILTHENMPNIIYGALESFFQKAQAQFKEFNPFVFQDFEARFKEEAFVQEIKRNGTASAFALYLLRHSDPRINFLSLFFIKQDPDEIIQEFPFIEIREMYYPFKDMQEIRKYVGERVEDGNLILRTMDLNPDNLFQPDKDPLYPLLQQGIPIENYLRKRLEGLIKQHQQEQTALSDNHTLNLHKKNQALEKEREEKKELEVRLAEFQGTIAELKREIKPEVPPDVKYIELEKKYQALLIEKGKLQGKVDRYSADSDRARAHNKELVDRLHEQEENLKELEADLTSLNEKMSKIKIGPCLRKYYGDKRVLMVCGIDKAVTSYTAILTPLFKEVEVIKAGTEQRQNPEEYDVIIIGTGRTQHGDRLWLEKRFENKLITFPLRPHMLPIFLYENHLPRECKLES